jgi:hypothetical protein
MRMRIERWAGMLGCAGCLLACGGSQAERPPPQPAQRSDQLATRPPQPAGDAGAPELGVLQPVAVPAPPSPPEPGAASASSPAPSEPAPIRIAAAPAPEPVALRGRDLVFAGGLIIHGVPASVTVRKVSELGSDAPVLELVDKRGRRLALLKETSLTRVALPGGSPLLEATAAARTEATRDDWDTTPVKVAVDRFQSDTHVYVLERRATGTDWIQSGLEITVHR